MDFTCVYEVRSMKLAADSGLYSILVKSHSLIQRETKGISIKNSAATAISVTYNNDKNKKLSCLALKCTEQCC